MSDPVGSLAARRVARSAAHIAVLIQGRDFGRRDAALMAAIVLAIVLIAYAALRPTPIPAPPPVPHAQAGRAATASAVAMPPVVDPVILMPVDAKTAEAMNAAVPFVRGPRPAAAALTLAIADDDLQRATDCLAAAVGYEAGDDEAGERAVAQVVLNRVRHPAFPKTVCDVVFQGSERATGCQFTFTCDGAIDRRPLSPATWTRARAIAHAALIGGVYAPVGLSTHYHTDWVVPYWAASLDKLSKIGTQIFYRWRGWWGTPPAFRAAEAGAEPIEPALAAFSDVHKPADQLLGLRVAAALGRLTVRHDGAAFTVMLDAQTAPETLPALASTLCAGLDQCVVIGRAGTQRPGFVFRHDAVAGADLVLYDCMRYKRATPACLTEPVWKGLQQDASRLALPPVPPLVAVPAAAGDASIARADAGASSPATPAGVAKADTVVPSKAELLPPPRPRADPCRAMRSVAAADRIGPCARRGY